MATDAHHIRLVAGIEIRPPTRAARFVLERESSERLAGYVAEDLAACVASVTDGRLMVGPALLEPGQVLSPAHGAWRTLIDLAARESGVVPGVIAIGAANGRVSHPSLAPRRAADGSPDGSLFVCLPLLLSLASEQAGSIETELEQKLFDQGGLRPPALATLAECTGLQPVHGQLLTRVDLMALLKMQLAGAHLEPFWPPVEHAVLDSNARTELDLPAGLKAEWLPEECCWQFDFEPVPESPAVPEDYALWLRAFRQTTALLDSFLIDWQARPVAASLQADPGGHWLVQQPVQAPAARPAGRLQHPELGLIGFVDGDGCLLLPVDSEGAELLA
ncbi:MAG: hypothetical protein ACNA7E_07010, partial [Wenzhouxiangellaceae bacterium]